MERGASSENLAIITKDFEKSSLVLQKVGGGMPCVNFLLASNTLYFPPILLLSINTSDFCISRRR